KADPGQKGDFRRLNAFFDRLVYPWRFLVEVDRLHFCGGEGREGEQEEGEKGTGKPRPEPGGEGPPKEMNFATPLCRCHLKSPVLRSQGLRRSALRVPWTRVLLSLATNRGYPDPGARPRRHQLRAGRLRAAARPLGARPGRRGAPARGRG